MDVRNFMSNPVVTLPSSTRAIDALELMQAKKIRRIPILEDGRLTGILTMGDIQSVLGLQEHSVRRAATKLGDVMTRKVHTVSADDPLERGGADHAGPREAVVRVRGRSLARLPSRAP